MNSECGSDQRTSGIESHVGSEDSGDLSSQRRHTKVKDKVSPLCYIDGHPPNLKVRVHPGECGPHEF